MSKLITFRRVESEYFELVNDLKVQYNNHIHPADEDELALEALANLMRQPGKGASHPGQALAELLLELWGDA
jgi:hypothetical protein